MSLNHSGLTLTWLHFAMHMDIISDAHLVQSLCSEYCEDVDVSIPLTGKTVMFVEY